MKKVIISMIVCLAACSFADSMAAVKPTTKISDYDFDCWTLEAHSSNDDNLAVDQYCKICRFISLISGEGIYYFNLTTHEKILDAVKKLPPEKFPSLGEVQYIPSLDVDSFQSVFVQKFVASREDLEESLESYVQQITIVLQMLKEIQKNNIAQAEIKILKACIDELQSSHIHHAYFQYKAANDKLKQAQAVFDDEKLITFSAMVFYILYGAMKKAKLAF